MLGRDHGGGGHRAIGGRDRAALHPGMHISCCNSAPILLRHCNPCAIVGSMSARGLVEADFKIVPAEWGNGGRYAFIDERKLERKKRGHPPTRGCFHRCKKSEQAKPKRIGIIRGQQRALTPMVDFRKSRQPWIGFFDHNGARLAGRRCNCLVFCARC